VDVPRRLSEPVEVAAYCESVFEAPADPTTHALASYFRVSARAGDGIMCLSVHDDGVGGAARECDSGLMALTGRRVIVCVRQADNGSHQV
jgi:hypothetical protein